MEHKCDEKKLILIKHVGTLDTYMCPICRKEFYELGSIVIPNDKPLQKCKIYMEWSSNISLVEQINELKNIVPDIKKMGNIELLKIAKKNEKLEIGEMYLNEAKELVKRAKTRNLIFIIEEI